MLKVGIDALAVYTPRYALDLSLLAQVRHSDPDKILTGLGQKRMAVPPPGEDIVTMAANAAKQVLQNIDTSAIEMLLFATETGIDQSKAAGIYVHDLVNLPTRCRVVELKQACYAGTAAIQLALPFLRENPTKKVLFIAADIARYGLETNAESSQGAGAVAAILTANPRLLAFDAEYAVSVENIMDFWRPNYRNEALVEGQSSSRKYLEMLKTCWLEYHALSERHFQDHAYYCYHIPVPRLVEKAHVRLFKSNAEEPLLMAQIQPTLAYARQIGNSYTASLFISLASLLDNASTDLARQRIGFYSYGSGCIAEYFSAVIQAGYRESLHTNYHKHLLDSRNLLEYADYEAFYSFTYPEDGSHLEIPIYQTGDFRLARYCGHQRVYEPV
ncbi:MAG: hydroxymethylglutaryl-CoA synthase [Pseudomonadota bacterium]